MKQSKVNKLFIETVTDAYFAKFVFGDTIGFCEWLVHSGIFPETVLNKWLAVVIYKKELKATKTAKKPNGVKWIAVQKTISQVPICARKLHSILKNLQRGETKGGAYNLQKFDCEKG